MAIKKDDLLKKLYQHDISEASSFEKYFDEQLNDRFEEAGALIQIKLENLPNPRVMQILIQYYKDAGWELTFMEEVNFANFK
jgi:hypothetical protein